MTNSKMMNGKVAPIDDADNVSSSNLKGGQTVTEKQIPDYQDYHNDDIMMPAEDEKIARNFLNCFLLNDEGSAISQINLLLFFRSIPDYIKMDNLRRVKLYNFKLMQESLVAYMNTDDVSAFEYFDDKNKDRVLLVTNQLHVQKKSIGSIKDTLASLEQVIESGAKRMGKPFDEDEKQREQQIKLTSAVTNF